MSNLDVGMNLYSVNYWGSEEPFIDRMKTAEAWYGAQQNAQRTSDAVPVDANGNPIALPSGAVNATTNIELDPSNGSTSHRYVLTYSGTGDFGFLGANVVSSQPGKIVIDFTRTGVDYLTMFVSNLKSSDPLHDIHLVRDDQVSLFNSGEVFNPDFISKVAPFGTLRFMDWGITNTLKPVSWASRTTEQSASWSQDTGSGVPVEVMVKLANETHNDMWFNIPTEATDDFVRNAMTYIRDHLDPSLKVKVEYSNEMWNWAFPQSKWAQQQANNLWGKDVDGNGTVDMSNPLENVQGGNEVYYGYRSAQIEAIAHQVFGSAADGRLEGVLGTQLGYQGLENYIFDGVAKAGVGSVSSLFKEYAVTTYFGGSMDAYGNTADQQTVIGWARSGSAGMDQAFKQLQSGGLLTGDSGDSLAALTKWYAYQEAVAQKNGLNLVAYEGGAHLLSAGFPAAVQQEVADFFGRLMNDPRMGQLYTQMVKDFATAGGTELTAFADSGHGGVGGYWGLLQSIYDSGSVRYDALLAANNAFTIGGQTTSSTSGSKVPTSSTSSPVTTSPSTPVITTDVHTSLSTYTMDANALSLTYSGSGSFTGVGNAHDNVITGGSSSDKLSGMDGNDTLIGGAGNDTLDGGTGADVMKGGAGNDLYYVDNRSDVVVENPGQGNDCVSSSIDYTLGANVERLILTGGATNGTGNALDNVITNNNSSGSSVLSGGAGNDTLIGGSGNDTLLGGEGNDVLNGGAGNDFIRGNAGADTMTGGAGADRFYFAWGASGSTLATADQITDFSRSDGDKIDFSGYASGLHHQLHFLGSSAFTHHVGDVRVVAAGNQWDVQIDINGDGRADEHVLVTSTNGPLVASDFILGS